MHAYDLMAIMCHRIEILDNEEKKKIYKEYFSTLQNYNQDIESTFPFLSKTYGGVEKYNLFSEAQIHRMLDYIDDCKPVGLLRFLSYLDGYLDIDKNFKIFCDSVKVTRSNVSYFFSLSECTQGYLIPNFKSKWQKNPRHTLEEQMQKPLSILQNYIWIDKQCFCGKVSTEWEVLNVYSDKWNWNDFDNPFKIVCSPLTATCPYTYSTSFCENTKQNHFYISEYKETEQIQIKSTVERVLDYANTQKAHIALFPEMMVSKECQFELQKIVGAKWWYSHPKLICLPSSVYQDNHKCKNCAKVLDDSGDEIFSYNKQQEFQLEINNTKFFEDIEPDHRITIIHVKGIGRIAIIICADVFNQDIKEILFKKYEITLMLIIAFTNGVDLFYRSFSCARESYCDVVWCNTCAAYNVPEEGQTIKQEECIMQYNRPVAAYFPYGHNSIQEIIAKGCDRSCCKGCGIVISIPSKYNEIGRIDLFNF